MKKNAPIRAAVVQFQMTTNTAVNTAKTRRITLKSLVAAITPVVSEALMSADFQSALMFAGILPAMLS